MAFFIIAPDVLNKPHDITSEEVKGVTIIEWLNSYYAKHGAFDREMMCVVDNEVIPFDQFHTFTPADNQNVVFTQRVEGFISLIITIISLVVSVYLALTLTVPEDSTPEFGSAPSYSLQGKSNRRKLGEPIEVHFGRISNYYPSYAAASYTRYVGGIQKLYQLFCVGSGDFDFTLADIRIKDTPITNYQDVQVEVVRPFNQPTLFTPNVETSVSVNNIRLLGPNEVGYPVDGWYGPFVAGGNAAEDEVFAVEIDLEGPNGLYRQYNGDLYSVWVIIESQYQELDDMGNPVGGWVQWLYWDNNWTQTSPVRGSFIFNTPNPAATYQIRTRRITDSFSDTNIAVQDKVFWTGLKAFKQTTESYGDVTLIAVEAQASNSISGSAAQSVNLDFTAYNCHPSSGRMAYEPNRSIVGAFISVFTKAYGGNLPCDVMDWDTLLTIDAEMEAQGRYFDWTFDQRTTVWEAAKAIARCARATPLMSGSYITLKRDVLVSQPEAIFTPYNIVENSFSKNLRLPKLNDYDGVEIEYIDIDSGNQEQILCLLGDDEGINPQQIQYIGQRDRNWAYREGLFIRAQQKAQREQVVLTTGMEGLPVQYGSRIAVASEVSQKDSIFGRIVDIVSTTVTLDQPVVFDIGIDYAIAIRAKDGGQMGPYTVTEGANEYEVILAAPIPNDWQVLDTQEQAFFVFGEEVVSDYKVTSVIPLGLEEVQIEAINYDETVYSYDSEIAPDIPTAPAVPQIPDLPVVATVTVTQAYDLDVAQVAWTPALGATSYIVQTSYDGATYSSVAEVATTDLTIAVPRTQFYIRVAGIGSARGPWSNWNGVLGIPTLPPVDVQNFRLLNQFVGPACETIWDAAQLAESYNVKVYTFPANTPVFDDSVLQTSYSFTAEDVASVTPVVRDYKLELTAVNSVGVSDAPAELIVNNPIPAAPTGISSQIITEDADTFVVQLSWDITTASDFRTFRAWGSDTQGFTPGPTNQIYDGVANQTTFLINKVGGQIPAFYWRVAVLDVWGDDTTYSPEQSTEQFINTLQVDPSGDTLEVDPSGDDLSVN